MRPREGQALAAGRTALGGRTSQLALPQPPRRGYSHGHERTLTALSSPSFCGELRVGEAPAPGNGHLPTGLSHSPMALRPCVCVGAPPLGYLPTAPMFSFRLPWSLCLQNHKSAGVWPSRRRMKWSLAGGGQSQKMWPGRCLLTAAHPPTTGTGCPG